MLKNADHQAFKWIALLMNLIFAFNIIPKNLNTSIIKPIKKDLKTTKFDVNNLRPISISNTFAQILERLILINNPILEKTHQNQFGFKRGISTLHPLFLLKEAALWCKSKDSPIYIASLEAFDSVWRDELFFKKKQKLNRSSWKVLKKYYSTSEGLIKINNTIDHCTKFKITRC
jgi:hypothetical protein